MIIVRNLVKTYEEQPALDHISFQADPGELIAVLGGSGSGKSTLLKCLALREKWSGGQYIYKGNDLTASGWFEQWFKLRKQIAYLEEKPNLNPNQTALSYVLQGRKASFPWWRRITFSTPEDEYMFAMDMLENVGLLDKAKQKIGQLSGGERQRVAIAHALAKGASICVADEPVTGLDPHSSAKLMEDIRNTCQKKSIIFICTLHQTELAEKFATRMWGLSNGKILFDIRGRRLTQRERESVF